MAIRQVGLPEKSKQEMPECVIVKKDLFLPNLAKENKLENVKDLIFVLSGYQYYYKLKDVVSHIMHIETVKTNSEYFQDLGEFFHDKFLEKKKLHEDALYKKELKKWYDEEVKNISTKVDKRVLIEEIKLEKFKQEIYKDLLSIKTKLDEKE